MDYNKWKRTPEEKRKRKISRKLVKYINNTPLFDITMDKLNEIMGTDLEETDEDKLIYGRI